MPLNVKPQPTASSSTPFIIWTLQRTGGTNLAQHLFRSSALPGTSGPVARDGVLARITNAWRLHEPFNLNDPERPFGTISEAWARDRDHDLLVRSIEGICKELIPIKHCVEMVPWEITECLVRVSVQAGYRHVFLHRRDSIARLLSLQFARATGIWGDKLRGAGKIRDSLFAEPLPVPALAAHESYCSALMSRTFDLLDEIDGHPAAISYEDIFEASSPALARKSLLLLLRHLNMPLEPEAAGLWAGAVLESGDQKTRELYVRFLGVDALRDSLRQTCRFAPHRPLIPYSVLRCDPFPSWVLVAVIDSLPHALGEGRHSAIGGVVVIAADSPAAPELLLYREEEAVPVRWHIESPLMAANYPAGANSATARFAADVSLARRNSRFSLRIAAKDYPETELYRLEYHDGSASVAAR
jgi:hypothetical protein